MLVGLEEQAPSRSGPDREVDLEQLALTALGAVLRQREVADPGVDLACAQRGDLVGAEGEAMADQPPRVGVDDAAAPAPPRR